MDTVTSVSSDLFLWWIDFNFVCRRALITIKQANKQEKSWMPSMIKREIFNCYTRIHILEVDDGCEIKYYLPVVSVVFSSSKRVNLIRKERKYSLSFLVPSPCEGTTGVYVLISLPVGLWTECGRCLDPYRVIVENTLWTSRNGNGTCVAAVHFICRWMPCSKQSYRTHSFLRFLSSLSLSSLSHASRDVCSCLAGLAATISSALSCLNYLLFVLDFSDLVQWTEESWLADQHGHWRRRRLPSRSMS